MQYSAMEMEDLEQDDLPSCVYASSSGVGGVSVTGGSTSINSGRRMESMDMMTGHSQQQGVNVNPSTGSNAHNNNNIIVPATGYGVGGMTGE